ncbi:MAG TPA: hypothetical protein VHS06_03835 [Chloroflexota bacterium]|nr:hypothetical protein [Chloroflexota bacterium]
MTGISLWTGFLIVLFVLAAVGGLSKTDKAIKAKLNVIRLPFGGKDDDGKSDKRV